jgi:hypothetical protein
MEFDLASLFLGAVILVLSAAFLGVTVLALWFWRRDEPSSDRWIIEDLDHLGGRLSAMGEQVVMLKTEIDDLSEEVERLQDERDQFLAVLLRIAELLERFPRSSGR